VSAVKPYVAAADKLAEVGVAHTRRPSALVNTLVVLALASLAAAGAACPAANAGKPLTNEDKLLNLDRVLLREKLFTVCTAAVVYLDGAAAGEAAVEEEEAGERYRPDKLEREVVEAFHNYLVGNVRFTVYAAPDEVEQKARAIIVARNANVIPAQQARELAATTGVEAIVTLTVEEQGRRVNFALYSGRSGRLLYAETLVNWDFHLVEAAPAE